MSYFLKMNKAIKKKLLIISIILGLGLFVGYIYKYQQLINEGSYLADEHCIKINPLIIDRKNKYLDQYNLILKAGSDTATAEEYHAALDKYMQASDVYQKEEKLDLLQGSSQQRIEGVVLPYFFSSSQSRNPNGVPNPQLGER